jgi:hypothetical protein
MPGADPVPQWLRELDAPRFASPGAFARAIHFSCTSVSMYMCA